MNINEFKNSIKKAEFKNPTKGLLTLKKVVEELVNFRKKDLESDYRIFIGTDSEQRKKGIDFVSVIAIHRIGKGGRYFWLRTFENNSLDLRSRMLEEATISLSLAQALLEQELENNHVPVVTGQSIKEAIESLQEKSVYSSEQKLVLTNDLEIHVDIGRNGPTRVMIKEIVGMIRGSGFNVKIKPEAFAAANVADKHL